MLTSGRALVLATIITVTSPSAALADGGGGGGSGTVTVAGDNRGGYVSTSVTAPATDGSHVQTASTSSGGGSGVTCTWTENPAFAEDLFLNWVGWGEKGGHWYDVRCSDGSYFQSIYVPPAANNVSPAIALAGSLARQALNRLALPVPSVGLNPRGRALVNLPEWFWIPRSQWRTLTQRTSAGPVWAEVAARPVSTSWDPGDGSAAVTCAGPGTPYDSSQPASDQSTDCSYTYRRSSADQPQTGPNANDRFFTVTVTTTWAVTWVGSAGTGGTLPVMTRSTSFELPVAQRESVVTGGSG